MHKQFKEFINQIVIGQPVRDLAMTVVPLFINEESQPAYLTLGQALNEGLVTISEVSRGGSVPNLTVENRADIPVIMLDGEEMVGAKQNRVVNTTILLEPNSTTVIPVSCTEQGRWSYRSPEFADSQTVMSPSIRHHKVRSVSHSLLMKMGHRSDQGRVWEEIDALSARAGARSATGAMRDVHEHLARKIEDQCQAFQLKDGQNGLFVVIGQRVVGFDILSRHESFARLYPKILRSYAADAVLDKNAQPGGNFTDMTRTFFETCTGASESRHKAVGLGVDCRFVGESVVGSALLVDPAVVHMAFFHSEAEDRSEPMLPSRVRSNFRRQR
ncbi:MAG: hypothetical protein PVH24_01065 [Candidatus Zixiibacteriota bacterium]|jgi:hypothetical protein